MPRVFEPLPETHPLVTKNMKCAVCQKPFVTGDRTTLIVSIHLRGSIVETMPVHVACARKDKDV